MIIIISTFASLSPSSFRGPRGGRGPAANMNDVYCSLLSSDRTNIQSMNSIHYHILNVETFHSPLLSRPARLPSWYASWFIL